MNSVDSNNLLSSPSYVSLQFWALMQNSKRKLYNIVHISAEIFILSQFIELWFIRNDLELAIRNLSVTMLSTVCIFKASLYVWWEEPWLELIDYVSNLEIKQLAKSDSKTKLIIDEYTTYSRRLCYFYRILIYATVLVVLSTPMFSFLSSSQHEKEMMKNGTIPYPEMMSSWVPFDRTRGLGYWVVMLEHTMICTYGGGVLANFDCNAIVIMTFIAGQFKILSINCARMFDDYEDLTDDEAIKRIEDCHYHHVNLVKYSSVMNSLLSPVMFLYVFICSLMICASAIRLNTESTSNMQRIWIAEYLMALITQLFLYCWHSNEVLYTSIDVDNGVYASKWYTQNVSIRRSVLLLSGQLRKSIEFTAGPFTNLNVATFIAILKGSYSYYTLLNQKED